LDNEWPISFGPISDPPAFGELYLVKYFGGFIYFISHAIKNRLKNAATLGLNDWNVHISANTGHLAQDAELYLTTPLPNEGLTGISLLSVSVSFKIVKTDKIKATIMKIELSSHYFPGQTL